MGLKGAKARKKAGSAEGDSVLAWILLIAFAMISNSLIFRLLYDAAESQRDRDRMQYGHI